MAGIARAVVGREEELDRLHAFVADVDGPATLLLEGEPGIGKTTVWEAGVAAAEAAGCIVLRSRPSQVETALSLAGLSDLLAEVVADVLPELPPPQQKALEVALLLEAQQGAPPDRRTVATAFLGVLRVLAARGPVVVAVDDVQWLDPPSAAVLDFALRRLRHEPVVVLASARDDVTPPFEPQERIALAPLSLGALHAILRERLGSSFPRPLMRRLHETSRGNPYYALELGAALLRRPEPPSPGEALPVPDSLEGLLRERVSVLPPAARRVLPVIAALADPSIMAVERALPRSASLDAAVRAGALVVEGERIRFDHPLLASYVYGALAPGERRALHARLALAAADPEERARHLALSAEPPAEEVAAVLDDAAEAAVARGAPDAAAELAEQAARFTPADRAADRARRETAAAEFHFAAGGTARARELLEGAVAAVEPGPARAAALVRLACVVEATEGLPPAKELFEQALAEAGADDAVRAEAHWRLAGSVTSLHAGIPEAAAHARAAVELAERSGDRGLLALALAKTCVYDFYVGRGVDREAIERALSLEDEIERVGMWLEERPSTILGAMTMYVVDFEDARARFERMRRLAEESGNDRALPVILFWLSRVALRGLSIEQGRETARQGLELAQQTGQKQIQAQLLFSLSAAEMYLGAVDEARAAARRGLELAEETGDLDGIVNNLHSLGLVELALGDYAAADVLLGRAVEVWTALSITEPRAHSLIPDAVEAASAVDPIRAEAVLAPYASQAARLGSGWPLGAVARCRGHLAAARGELEEAMAWFDRSIPQLEEWTPQDTARSLLALGTVQRRARRRGAARESLQRAIALFEQVGAVLWAERARAEIARLGGREPATDVLTPTERRIATLVAEGRTNKDVAAALFVAPRTVEGHLTRIYEKLGVRSRGELSHLLASGAADGEQNQGVSTV